MNNNCFILGLPAAGKTSFLAALWYSLNYSSKSVFSVGKYIGDNTYLSQISQAWADGIPVSRTNRDIKKEEIRIPLKLGEKQFFVTIPDLSGEIFQDLYQDRIINVHLADIIRKSSCMLLFISPTKINEPTLLADLPESLRKGFPKQKEFKERVPRDDDSTEAQLVELLQLVLYIRNNSPLRISIIVSAWDMIESNAKLRSFSPQNFVKETFPLLWQYVHASTELISPCYFGVSAQGGDILNANIQKKLLDKLDPCDRIIVVDDDKIQSMDISLPLFRIVSEE